MMCAKSERHRLVGKSRGFRLRLGILTKQRIKMLEHVDGMGDDTTSEAQTAADSESVERG